MNDGIQMHTNDGVGARLDAVDSRIDGIEERVKKKEPSLPAAIQTLIVDLQLWKADQRSFPASAVLGVINAYMRPRWVIYIGGLATGFFAIAQCVLLSRQNDLIDQQNYAMRAQTMAVLLNGEALKSTTGMTLLRSFGDVGIQALISLAELPDDPVATAAAETLQSSFNKLSGDERGATFVALAQAYNAKMGKIYAGASNAWRAQFNEPMKAPTPEQLRALATGLPDEVSVRLWNFTGILLSTDLSDIPVVQKRRMIRVIAYVYRTKISVLNQMAKLGAEDSPASWLSDVDLNDRLSTLCERLGTQARSGDAQPFNVEKSIRAALAGVKGRNQQDLVVEGHVLQLCGYNQLN